MFALWSESIAFTTSSNTISLYLCFSATASSNDSPSDRKCPSLNESIASIFCCDFVSILIL